MCMEKEQRKKYWEKARVNGWSAAFAARDLGPQVKAKSFQVVITNGYQSGELAPAVDDWLVENADRKPGRGIRKPKQIPPGDILGNKLISVGGTLISSKFDAIEKHPLTLAELRAVMLAFADIPVVLWMCLTGQRPSDARTLKFGDVDVPTRTVHRPSVKVRALRKFEICAEAARLVKAEATRPHSPADVVFRSSHGTPWSADGLLNTIKARCRKRTEIRHITPKMLRDAFGTIMANDIGLPLPELQILMGHTDIKTTMQYVRARGARTWLDTYDREIMGTTPLNGAQTGAQNTGTTG